MHALRAACCGVARETGKERERERVGTVSSRGCKLIYQRVQGEQVVLRPTAAGNLLNRDEFIFARRARPPCSCTREHRFRSLTPFAPGASNSILRILLSSATWILTIAYDGRQIFIKSRNCDASFSTVVSTPVEGTRCSVLFR